MKKTYEKPELKVETFEVSDVLTASSPNPGQGGTVNTVGNEYETIGFKL